MHRVRIREGGVNEGYESKPRLSLCSWADQFKVLHEKVRASGEKGGIPMTDYGEVLTKVVKKITYWRDEIATAGSEFGSIYSSAMNHALEIIFYEIEQADTERKVRKE